MKKLRVVCGALAVVGGVVLSGCSTAGERGGTAVGPAGGMKMGKDQMPACCQQMMGGMTPETKERMQLLMRVPIFLDAPCPIFAQAEKLGLSEEQQQKLGEIEKEARTKARAVLTPEQQAKLGPVPDKPVTMMGTCPMMKK